MSQLYFKSRDELLNCSINQLEQLLVSMGIYLPEDKSVENLVDIIVSTREAQVASLLSGNRRDDESTDSDDSYYLTNSVRTKSASHNGVNIQSLVTRLVEVEKMLGQKGKASDPVREKFKAVFKQGKGLFHTKKKHLAFELQVLKEIVNEVFVLREAKPEEMEASIQKILNIAYDRSTTLLVAGQGGWKAVSKFEHAYPKSMFIEQDPERSKAIQKCVSEVRAVKDKEKRDSTMFHPYAHPRNSYMGNNQGYYGYNQRGNQGNNQFREDNRNPQRFFRRNNNFSNYTNNNNNYQPRSFQNNNQNPEKQN